MRPNRSMTRFWTPDRALGLICIAAAVLIVFVWVPLDAGSGIVEKVRRRWEIGDGLAPTFAGGLLGLAGGLLLLSPGEGKALTRANAAWLFGLLAGLIAAFALMRWAGPALAALLTDGGYRPLRDTVPWKYVGYGLGGAVLITDLIAAVERRVTVRAVLIGTIAAAALAALYDLPFDDLLLPPNGDL